MKNKKTLFLILLFVVSAILVYAFAYGKRGDVDYALTSKKKLSEGNLSGAFTLGSASKSVPEISVTGTLLPVERADVFAVVSGTITSFNAVAGKFVRRGDVIARIDSPSLRSSLSVANATYEKALADYEYQRIMSETSGIRSDVDVKSAEIDKENQIKSAQQQLNEAYVGAFSAIRQSFDDAISALATMIDGKSLAYGNASMRDTLSGVEYEQLRAGKILLGASSDTARWESEFVLGLNGGLREKISAINTVAGSTKEIDNIRSELSEALEYVSVGLGYSREIASSFGDKNQIENVDQMITRINSAIARIQGAEQNIKTAKIYLDSVMSQKDVALEKNIAIQSDTKERYDALLESTARAVESARVSVSRAKSLLEDTVVRAPFDGVIEDVFASVGDVVMPGAPLVSVSTSDKWKVEFTVSDRFNEYIKTGTPVKLYIGGDSGSFEASIDKIVPAVDFNSKKIRFETYLNSSPESARSGLVVKGNISPSYKEKSEESSSTVFSIPNKYVGYGYNGTYVVSKDEKNIPITIISRNKNESQISGQGLFEGLEIIVPIF